MDFKAEGMKVLKEQLEKEGASKHDTAVTLAFNDTVIENLVTFVQELDNPAIAPHSLRVMSKLMLITAIFMSTNDNEGDTTK